MDPLLRLYLVLLPVSSLAVIPVVGARGTMADLILVLVVAASLVGGPTGAARPAGPPRIGSVPGGVVPAGLRIGVLLLGVYAAWVVASALWSPHPSYALAKGAGAAVLTGLVVVIARQGRMGLAAVADAWLVGAAISVGVTAGFLVLGSATRGVVTHEGGASLLGLARVSGTFGHPNLLGDWLVASGVLLWARWPAWRAPGSAPHRRGAAVPLAVALGGLLLFTASTAWAVAGLSLAFLPFHGMRRGRRLGLRIAGLALVAVTLIGTLVPVRVGPEAAAITTSGVRPAIWSSAAEAFLADPLKGVGAAPYLARAEDPVQPEAGELLWDAHSLPLSLLGQFGVVGFGLFIVGMALVVVRLRADRETRAGDGPRLRVALAVLVAGMVLQALLTASEEIRHSWVLVGMAAAWGVVPRRTPEPRATSDVATEVRAPDEMEWDTEGEAG